MAFEHPIAPYASVETLYDTRYDKWSRVTLKAGLETPIGGDWRVEPYLALQLNKPDDELKPRARARPDLQGLFRLMRPPQAAA